MYPMQTKEIANGVWFNSMTDARFKTDRISVHFILPLSAKTAAKNAIVPFILEKSSRTYPNFTALSRALDKLYGAALTGNVQKIGDNQILSLSITSIDDAYALDGEPMVQKLAEILAGNIFSPCISDGRFDPQVFAVEKQNLIDLIESQINDKRRYATKRAANLMYDGEPCGVDKLGSVESAKQLTETDAVSAYEMLLHSARVEVMFTGCGDPTPAEEIFTDAFLKVERKNIPETKTKMSVPKENVLRKTEVYSVMQSKLVLGFKMGETSPEDLYAIRLMVSLYGGTPTSKLFVNVREKMSLCYYCAARFDRLKNTMMVDSGVENANIKKAKDEILNQLEQIKNGNITAEELEYARLSLKNSFKTVGDSAAGVESWYLGQRVSGTKNAPEDEAAALDRITIEDICRVAKLVKLDTVYLLTGDKECAL